MQLPRALVAGSFLFYRDKENVLRKTTRLIIKKVTLQDLDIPTMAAVAAAAGPSDIYTACPTCFDTCVHTLCLKCA